MKRTYSMAEGRAQHEPSGLWHYVRTYGVDADEARLALAAEAIRRHWTLDGQSVRVSLVTQGEPL